MVDVDTFLTALYVMADDFCQSRAQKKRPGPKASLSESEVMTLAIFARWGRFASERDFYRYAARKLTDAFPWTLPSRPQLNRLTRSCARSIEEFALHLAETSLAECPWHAYEALDCSATPVRDCKRRGSGWLAGYADIGWSNSIGWYEGFSLLTSVAPSGVITGFCFAPASTADQRVAETFFCVRALPNERLASVGGSLRRALCSRQGVRGGRKPSPMARVPRGAGRLPAQTKQRPRDMAQTPQAMGGGDTPGRGDGLRQDLQRLRPLAGAAP